MSDVLLASGQIASSAGVYRFPNRTMRGRTLEASGPHFGRRLVNPRLMTPYFVT